MKEACFIPFDCNGLRIENRNGCCAKRVASRLSEIRYASVSQSVTNGRILQGRAVFGNRKVSTELSTSIAH